MFRFMRHGWASTLSLFALIILCSIQELNWTLDGPTSFEMCEMWEVFSTHCEDLDYFPSLENITLAIDKTFDTVNNIDSNLRYCRCDTAILWPLLTAPYLRSMCANGFCQVERRNLITLDNRQYSCHRNNNRACPHRAYEVPPRCSMLHTLRLRYCEVPIRTIENVLCLLPSLQNFEWIIPYSWDYSGYREDTSQLAESHSSLLRVLDWDAELIGHPFGLFKKVLQHFNWYLPTLRKFENLQRLGIPWHFLMCKDEFQPTLEQLRIKFVPKFWGAKLPDSLEVLALRYCDRECSFVSEQILEPLRDTTEMNRLKNLRCIRLQARKDKDVLFEAYQDVMTEAAAQGIDCEVDLEYFIADFPRDAEPPEPIK